MFPVWAGALPVVCDLRESESWQNSKYGHDTTFGECNGAESVFRNRRFPDHRFAESVVICQWFRDLLSPGDSGSVIIDREPGEP